MYSDLKIDNVYLGGLENTVPEPFALVAVTDPKDLAGSLTTGPNSSKSGIDSATCNKSKCTLSFKKRFIS